MPFIAILLDILTTAAYFFQLHNQTTLFLLYGILFQGVISGILFLIMVTYKGKKYAKIQLRIFVKQFSIRYSIIVFSFIINTLVMFLYVLNYLGINPVVFSF
ncbi:hypothetical protein ACIJDO_000364 [Enterococcus hirae]